MALADHRCPFNPVYLIDEDAPLLLHAGPGRMISAEGRTYDGTAMVEFDLRPSPVIKTTVSSTSLGPMGTYAVEVELPSAPPSTAPQRPSDPSGSYQRETERHSRLAAVGDLSAADRVRLHVVNLHEITQLRSVILTDQRASMIVSEPDRATLERLKHRGGYGITHTVDVLPIAGEALTDAAVESITDDLHDFLAYVTGARPGIGLAVGLDGESPVWARWAMTQCDEWRNTIGWFSPTLADELTGLWSAWQDITQVPIWNSVLPRVARILAVANRLDPLEVAITTAQSALELLAWTVLEIEERWIGPDSVDGGTMTTAGRARLLLAWAGIPAAIPPEYVHLLKKAAEDKNLVDGPSAAAWVRNRLTHPPRKPPAAWPSADLLHDTWRLTMDYAELVVLRVLGYEGQWGTRRHLEGRPVWSTEPVPWSK